MEAPPRTFHPFPRLPLELRQRIWELSIEPRTVAIRLSDGPRPDPYEAELGLAPQHLLDACAAARAVANVYPERTPPPCLLHVCSESRSHLQRFYQKAFPVGSTPRYTWVNFDADTVCMRAADLQGFAADLPLTRRLILETQHPNKFRRQCLKLLSDAAALETLTILDVDWRDGERWWRGWIGVIGDLYHRCGAPRFYARIKRAHDPEAIDITRDNSPRSHVCRPSAKRQPNLLGVCWDWELSDDDLDEWATRRWRWKHTKTCKCTHKDLLVDY
jgi:hypothetical protein